MIRKGHSSGCAYSFSRSGVGSAFKIILASQFEED